MATIVTRAGKGSPLTHNEVDANFTNLNTDKAESASPAFTGQASFADGSAAAPSITNTGDLNAGLFFPAADTVAITTSGAEAMRIDSSGNVGIGVTPSAWSASWRAAQVGAFGSFAAHASVGAIRINSNAFDDGVNKYIGSTFASQYEQYESQHKWYTAPSGTAGNAITFTQAMTLDASGNLGIGTTSPASKLDVNGIVRDAAGDVRDLVNSSKTAAYVPAATDNGKLINITTGGITINASVFSAGQNVTIYNNSASSQTITQGTSVTMYLAGSATTGNRTLAQRGICTILCVASNTFVCSGAGVT
jgi:hypothetical protein